MGKCILFAALMFPGSDSQLLPLKPKLKTTTPASSSRVIICITNRAPSFASVYGLSTWGLRSSENFKSFGATQPLRDLQRLDRNFVLRKKFWFARQRWPTCFVRENRSPEKWRNLPEVPGLFCGRSQAKLSDSWLPIHLIKGFRLFIPVCSWKQGLLMLREPEELVLEAPYIFFPIEKYPRMSG